VRKVERIKRAASLGQLFVAAAVVMGLGSCGGNEFPVEPTPVCSITIAPTDSTFGNDGGNGSVTVTVAAGCAWTASTSGDWVVVTSANTGTGNGTVSYSVRANSATQSRTGVLSIGGRNHTVTQQGRPPVVCTYQLSADAATVGNEGGTQSFGVNAPTECDWSARSDAAWISVTSGSTGSGSGTVSYSVAPNNDVAERTGTITVADRKFAVRQSGEIAACRYSVAPVEFNRCMPAGTAVANLTTEASCPWTATADSSWVGLPGGTSGRGSITITITYNDNYDAPRHGIVMVRWPTPTAGQNIHVFQAGCVYAVSRTTFSVASSGGSATFDVIQRSDPNTCGGATQDQCLWTAQSTVPWITITSSMPRRGDNPVAFVVAANDSALARSGTITIRDKVVTITQAGR
jgi:hypothetical protein